MTITCRRTGSDDAGGQIADVRRPIRSGGLAGNAATAITCRQPAKHVRAWGFPKSQWAGWRPALPRGPDACWYLLSGNDPALSAMSAVAPVP